MDALHDLVKENDTIARLVAGQISPEEFFSQDAYNEHKQNFLSLFRQACPNLQESKSFFGEDNLASAWLTKCRYNQNMTNEQFEHLIDRGAQIFQGKFEALDFANKTEKNDLCAMMWGMEALNGVQSYDSGATRIRLAEGVSHQIIKAMEDSGATRRESTHAVGTRLLSDGLGKDVADENLRRITPRGMGALLLHPTSADGSTNAVIGKSAKMHECLDKGKNFDLLLKQEDYGYKDSLIHTREHTRVLTVLNKNIFSTEHKQYLAGKELIYKKSDLAIEVEKVFGKASKMTRKEHLSELKEQSKPLVDLLKEGKKNNWFPDFGVNWNWRIKFPPFEMKIVSSQADKKLGIGKFLHDLLEFKNANQNNPNLKQKFDALSGLINQAQALKENTFAFSREGNEVLVDCSEGGKAQLLEKIGKTSDNSPVLEEQVENIRTDDLERVNSENAENGFPTYAVVTQSKEPYATVAVKESASPTSFSNLKARMQAMLGWPQIHPENDANKLEKKSAEEQEESNDSSTRRLR